MQLDVILKKITTCDNKKKWFQQSYSVCYEEVTIEKKKSKKMTYPGRDLNPRSILVNSQIFAR